MFSPPLGTDTVPDPGGATRETRLQARTQDFLSKGAMNSSCDLELNPSRKLFILRPYRKISPNILFSYMPFPLVQGKFLE